MSLWHKPERHDEDRLSSRMWSGQGSRHKSGGRSENEAERFAEFSRLSAKIVELSLQQAHHDQTLRDKLANNVAPGSWPFLGTSIDSLSPARPSIKNAGTAGAMAGKTAANGTAHLIPQSARGRSHGWRSPNLAALRSRTMVMIREMTQYLSGSTAIGNLRRCWKSVQKDHWFSISRTCILDRLRLAVRQINYVRERTAFWIEHGSRRSARTFQFLTDRVPAGVQILTQLEPWLRLKHARLKIWMLTVRMSARCAAIKDKFAAANEYRCKDCGGKNGFRSRPHNLMERYILPLFLMQAARCAECFRRDYRLISTPLRERSPHNDERADPIHRNAA